MRAERLVIVILVLAAMCALQSGAFAWEWPEQMTIGGFNVTSVKGEVRPDGSGAASGVLQIPRADGEKIALTRSAGGDITGSSSIDTRIGGIGVQGTFALNGSGLRGRGIVKTSPKPIVDASMTVSKGGQVTGSGRVELGRQPISVNFSLTGSLDVSGTTTVKDQTETALATYVFQGRINLQGKGGSIVGTASGTVQRTGKLAGQSSDYPVANAPVNLSNGSCSVNVGGVSVTFRLL